MKRLICRNIFLFVDRKLFNIKYFSSGKKQIVSFFLFLKCIFTLPDKMIFMFIFKHFFGIKLLPAEKLATELTMSPIFGTFRVVGERPDYKKSHLNMTFFRI